MDLIGRLFSVAVIAVGLLVGVETAASTTASVAQTARLSALVRNYSSCEGVDVVKVGSLGTSLLRTMLRASVMDDVRDPDARALLSLVHDIKGITIMDYSDASNSVRNAISTELGSIFSKNDNLLMEVKDGGDDMFIYAAVSEDGADLKDFVLYTPSDRAIIWIKGKISAEAIAEMAR